METKPTTIRLNKNTVALIDLLKSENKGKFGLPTTSQIINYAIQLAACEQVKDNEDIEYLKKVAQLIDIDSPKKIMTDRIEELEYVKEQREIMYPLGEDLNTRKEFEEFYESFNEGLEESIRLTETDSSK